MNDEIQLLLETSQRINSKTISLTRCLLLTLLGYFADGLQYREMKAALKMSDGKLISNLNRLEAMGYIKKSIAELERRKLAIYSLTPKGGKEVKKITEWMSLVQKIAQVGDEDGNDK